MTPPHEDDSARDWSSIDSDAEAEEFVEAMDEEAAQDEVLEIKARNHELLNLSSGDRVLDVGCGQGVDVRLLAERVGSGGTVVGVDHSETMLDAARERTEAANVRFEIDDAMDLTFTEDSFDATHVERVLLHLESPEQALSELVRVTRPGGRVGITEADLGSIVIDTPGGHSLNDLSFDYAVHQHPTMGRQLYRLSKRAGLIDLDLDIGSQAVTDAEYLSKILMIEDWLDAMQNADEITEAEASQWLNGCRSASDDGEFFAAGMSFTVAGTVPEQA